MNRDEHIKQLAGDLYQFAKAYAAIEKTDHIAVLRAMHLAVGRVHEEVEGEANRGE